MSITNTQNSENPIEFKPQKPQIHSKPMKKHNLVSVLRGNNIGIDVNPRLHKELPKPPQLLVRFRTGTVLSCDIGGWLGCDGTAVSNGED